jgi:hypothetical protein
MRAYIVYFHGKAVMDLEAPTRSQAVSVAECLWGPSVKVKVVPLPRI